MKKKIIIGIVIMLIIIVSILFSIFKFNVYNPISSFSAIIQILFSDIEYTVVQNTPNKVIFAKPQIEIFEKYMKDNGYECVKEEKMGAIHVYRNNTHKVKIHFSMNQHYSKWVWEDSSEIDKISDVITSENYGDYINYPIDLNSDGDTTNDWKIFYNDGENVFIISSSVCSNSYIPDDMGIEKRGEYNIYWHREIDKYYTGSLNIDYDVGKKFMFNWLDKYYDFSNRPMKAVANLLDTKVWKFFIDENYAEMAIGSPTLEMFAASWNSKGYGPIEILEINIDGYDISIDGNDEIIDFKMNEIGCNDTLYFPVLDEEKSEECLAYVLASHAMTNNSGGDIYEIGIAGRPMLCSSIYYDQFHSFRPVVCLKSELEIEKMENDIWYIK